MKDILQALKDEPELQAAVRSAEIACNSAADSFRSFADTCRLVSLWCDKYNVNSVAESLREAESAQRRQKRRSAIFSGGGPDGN